MEQSAVEIEFGLSNFEPVIKETDFNDLEEGDSIKFIIGQELDEYGKERAEIEIAGNPIAKKNRLESLWFPERTGVIESIRFESGMKIIEILETTKAERSPIVPRVYRELIRQELCFLTKSS